mgnify:FL=1
MKNTRPEESQQNKNQALKGKYSDQRILYSKEIGPSKSIYSKIEFPKYPENNLCRKRILFPNLSLSNFWESQNFSSVFKKKNRKYKIHLHNWNTLRSKIHKWRGQKPSLTTQKYYSREKTVHN